MMTVAVAIVILMVMAVTMLKVVVGVYIGVVRGVVVTTMAMIMVPGWGDNDIARAVTLVVIVTTK